MAELTSKDKLLLAHFYETDDFKAFVKLCNVKAEATAKQILAVDMAVPGAAERISMMQGQYNALAFLQLEIKKIHKNSATEP